MGIIMLVCLVAFGSFAFPAGVPVCSSVGLAYGIKNKDKSFIKWCSLALLAGIACIIYTLLTINYM